MTALTFTEDSIGYMEDGGDIGGDNQISAAPQRRFIAPTEDGNFAVVTVSAYVTREDAGDLGDDDTDNGLDLEEQIEYRIQSSADSSEAEEIYSDLVYGHPFDFAPSTVEQGLAWAQNRIKNYSASDFTWSGSEIHQ